MSLTTAVRQKLQTKVSSPAKGLRIAMATFAVTTLVGLIEIAGVNYAANPLYIYDNGKQTLRTGERIFFRLYTRIAKPHIITGREITGIAYGSSRTEYSMDPTHPIFGAHGYNGGLSGGSIFDMREMVYHTAEVSRPQTIVLMINTRNGMQVFAGARRAEFNARDYTTLAASSDGKGSLYGHYLARASLLISWFQADLAIKNWRMRNRSYIAGVRYHLNGQRYHQKDRKPEEIRGALQSFTDSIVRQASAKLPSELDLHAMEALEDTVRHAFDRLPNVRLIVITEPIHASMYAAGEPQHTYDYVGEASLAASRAVEKASGGKADFWDCSLVNDMSAELVPPPSTAQLMQWWYDSSHPSSAFGRKILDQIQTQTDAGPCMRVDSKTEAAYVARRAGEKHDALRRGVSLFPELLADRMK